MFYRYFGIYIRCIFILLWKFIGTCYHLFQLKRSLNFLCLEGGHLGFLTIHIFVGENYNELKFFISEWQLLGYAFIQGFR